MNLDQLYETVIEALTYNCIRIHDRNDKFVEEEYGSPYTPRTLDMYIHFSKYVIYDFFSHQTTFFKYVE